MIAALAFILYGSVLELNYYAVIPSYCTTHPGFQALQAIIFVNLFAFLAVAYLAGLLSAKLRQVGVQLQDTSGALENLQVLHENIVHSISSGLVTTGMDGRITLVNAAAQRLLERTAAELVGKPVNELFTDLLPTMESQHTHGSPVRESGKVPKDPACASDGADSSGFCRAGIRLCAGRFD